MRRAIPERDPPIRFRQAIPTHWHEIGLREGRNRQIRRVAEALAHPVLDLQRTAISGLSLGDLAEGCWMWLGEGEWKPLLERADPLDRTHSPCD